MGPGNVRQPEFGRRLRRLREERGLSQRDAAGDVVNPSYISLLESGSRVPTLEVVVRLAQVLDVTVRELVGSAVLPDVEFGDRDGRLVLDILARSSLDFGDVDGAERRFRAAYVSACRDGQVMASLEYGIALSEILTLRAESADRYAHLAELAELAHQLDVPEVQVKIDVDRATAAREVGRLPEALRLAEAAAERIGSTALASTSEHVRALGVLVSVRCETGELAELAELVERMLAVAEKIDSRPVIGRAHWVASVAFARLGDAARVERHVHRAKEMLATPATPLREWARFSRAAASALLDAGAELTEVEQYLRGARTTLSMVDVPGEAALLRVLEARFALASGDAERALELAGGPADDLPVAEQIRLRSTEGRALAALGRVDEAVTALLAAAQLYERGDMLPQATAIWRQIDDLRPGA